MHRRRRALWASALMMATTVAVTPQPAVAGGGCHRTADGAQTEAAGTTVELLGACTGPTVLHAEAGDEITFVNRDPMLHNVVGFGWGVDRLEEGETLRHRFDAPGTYPYVCTLHYGMVGAVVVDGAVTEGEVAGAASGVRPSGPAATTGSAMGVPLVAGGSFLLMALGFGAGALTVLTRRRSASP